LTREIRYKSKKYAIAKAPCFYKKVSKDLWKFLEVGFSLLYIGIFLGCIALFIKGGNYMYKFTTS